MRERIKKEIFSRTSEKKIIMIFDQKGYKNLVGIALAVYLLLLNVVGYPIKIYFAGKKFLKTVLNMRQDLWMKKNDLNLTEIKIDSQK